MSARGAGHQASTLETNNTQSQATIGKLLTYSSAKEFNSRCFSIKLPSLLFDSATSRELLQRVNQQWMARALKETT